MPMSPHRPTLAGFLLLLFATLGIGGGAVAAAQGNEAPTNPIVRTALKYDATWQDQCWIFVRKVVFEATGREMGFDYRLGFFEAGAVEVSVKDAGPGDVIQIADDKYTLPDADYDGLHTFIITANRGNGVFDGIDSNRNFDGKVHTRAGYVPRESAERNGLNYHIYRFPAPTNPNPGGNLDRTAAPNSLARGDRAVVISPEGLNLRKAPGIDQPVLKVLADGVAVTITSDKSVAAGGRSWVAVRAAAGEGWVAADFLRAQVGAPVTASGNASDGNGGSQGRPLTQYRVFVASVAMGGE